MPAIAQGIAIVDLILVQLERRTILFDSKFFDSLADSTAGLTSAPQGCYSHTSLIRR